MVSTLKTNNVKFLLKTQNYQIRATNKHNKQGVIRVLW